MTDAFAMQNFRTIAPLNISMDASSPIAFLHSSQEEWLDIDDLSPSLSEDCLQDVETMALLSSGQRQQYGFQHNGQSLVMPESAVNVITDHWYYYLDKLISDELKSLKWRPHSSPAL